MECKNCEADIDIEWVVEQDLINLLETGMSIKEVKDFLDTKFDFSINQACDRCYHTYWFEDDEKQLWYDSLDNLSKESEIE